MHIYNIRVVGFRIGLLREMVFTLCLKLDHFFQRNPMVLTTFWQKVPNMPNFGPRKGQNKKVLLFDINNILSNKNQQLLCIKLTLNLHIKITIICYSHSLCYTHNIHIYNVFGCNGTGHCQCYHFCENDIIITFESNIVLFKLDKIGIKGPLHSWLSSYLSNRQQCVVIQGYRSRFR